MKALLILPLAYGLAAYAPQSVEVPPPLQSVEQEIAAQELPPEDAEAIAARQRLNAAVRAKSEAADAANAAAQAEYQAALRAHEASVAAAAKATAEYEAQRAAYEQRQKEIADFNACQAGDKRRCPPKPKK